MFWTLLTAFVAASVSGAAASTNQGPTACVSFDINWNLLAFGFNGKDYNVGTQDAWTSSGGVCCAFLRRRFLTVCSPDRHHDDGTTVRLLASHIRGAEELTFV